MAGSPGFTGDAEAEAEWGIRGTEGYSGMGEGEMWEVRKTQLLGCPTDTE